MADRYVLFDEIVRIVEAIGHLERKVREYQAHERPDQFNMFTGALEHPDTRWHKEIAELRQQLDTYKRAFAFASRQNIEGRSGIDALQRRVERTFDLLARCESLVTLEQNNIKNQPRLHQEVLF